MMREHFGHDGGSGARRKLALILGLVLVAACGTKVRDFESSSSSGGVDGAAGHGGGPAGSGTGSGPAGSGGGGATGGNGAGDAGAGGEATSPSWDTFERVGHDDLANEVSNFFPQVAVSASGDALLVFYDQSTVWARRYVKESDSWDPLLQLNDATSGGVNATVAVDAEGNGMVVWYSHLVGGAVFARRFTASLGWPAGWSPVETVAEGTAGLVQQSMTVAMTPAGHAVVGIDVRTNDNSSHEGYMAIYENGQGWRTPVKVSGSTTSASGTAVGVSTVGTTLRAVAAWHQSDGERLNVLGNVVTYDLTTHNGIMGDSKPLETDDTLDHLSPRVVMDGNGNAMVVFLQRGSTGSESHVIANSYSGGAWTGATGVDTAGESASDYSVAMNEEGEGVVVFRQCGPACAIWARRFSGANFRPADKLSTDENSVGGPEVAVDGAGRGLAVWAQKSAALPSIFASELSPALGWTEAHALEDDNAAEHAEPAVAFGPNGTGIAAWVRETTTNSLMRRSIFADVYKY
ncbi:hypothetical protein [Sorangium sp. So ce406]|uniref:hypothetical protein n=1 Tax=Sorangium sp. So ce406 TaxID=3133311 RepID=UPI003F5AE723